VAAGSTAQAGGGDFRIARHVLAAQRTSGADFDTAWALALRLVGREDRATLVATRGAWANAYNRQPFYSGKAFGTLAGIVDGDTEARQTQVVR
jgi:hypothetical protein